MPQNTTDTTSVEETTRQTQETDTQEIVPIEVKWNIPSWMLTKPVDPHMQESPEELD